jgi:hypothetical protein
LMAFTGVISPAGPMSDADIEASRVYRKLDERGLIKCPLWLAFRTFPRYQKGVYPTNSVSSIIIIIALCALSICEVVSRVYSPHSCAPELFSIAARTTATLLHGIDADHRHRDVPHGVSLKPCGDAIKVCNHLRES